MMNSFAWPTLALCSMLAFASCSTGDGPAQAPALDQTAGPAPQVPTAPVPVPEAAAPAPATAKLNPPHGEPGHRCEIPVGAPLDGAPAPAPVTTITPQAGTAVVPAPAPVSTNASGKLNPAHGEPGHDCAVPVGSPLPG